MTIYLPLLFILLGMLLWSFTKDKLSEFGRLMVLAGLIVTCMQLAGHAVHLFR